MARPRDPHAAWSLLLLLCVAAGCSQASSQPPSASPPPQAAARSSVAWEEARPVLEKRCVVCHGCYDAPCQVQLSSHPGVERGGTKQPVYHSTRLRAVEPTRLFVDAPSTAAWRERGFHSVLEGPSGAFGDGLLAGLLALGQANPLPPGERLPESIPLDIDRELACPTAEELPDFAREHPLQGMPYGMARLTEAEMATLGGWLASGAPPPEPRAGLPASLAGQLDRWETFLNQQGPREQLVARYVYEHWFLFHLYFPEHSAGTFFRLVRSATPPGEPVEVIPTRRPYDAPGRPFWYRLARVERTIVHKTHIVYPLGRERLARLEFLFLASAWNAPAKPRPRDAANPFLAFAAIPADARYQFLLDDAQAYFMTFIRGPVCRGRVAVDVIRDRFFVLFLDPDHDVSVTDPSFLEEAAPLLRLPAQDAEKLLPRPLWIGYDVKQRRYRALREERYDALDPQRRGPALGWLWDGDGHNRNALLTVFRHDDNASVVQGLVGDMPQTGWVVDYPLFERIYYDLVAGFDVFGSAGHQIATRLYMDHLRMQGEDLFLAFLPEERRAALQDAWYEGAKEQLHFFVGGTPAAGHGTQLRFSSDDPVGELFTQVLERDPSVAGPPDLLNRCPQPASCVRPGASAAEQQADATLRRLIGRRGPWVATLPDLALLRVLDAQGQQHAVYSLVHDKAHTNVAFMFGEEKRRRPERDELTVMHGVLGSYPNFLFDVPSDALDGFVDALLAVEDATGLEALVERWGVRRTSPDFWAAMDWIHEDFRRHDPIRAGLLDLNRYRNL